MVRKIFVGSSTEGEKEALEVCKLLNSEDTEAVHWRQIFAPSSLTFEALENMLLECCGAVFVATPDDDGTIRGRTVKMPRANIMLEFGLVAGRLGRHNIALCTYGQAELPSDLRGLTVIQMEPAALSATAGASTSSDANRTTAQDELRLWSSKLVGTAERIVRTDIVHGYTGRWTFSAALSKWRGLQVDFPSYSEVSGFLDLYVPPNGQVGRGIAHGRITFKVFDPRRKDPPPFQGEARLTHDITNVICSGEAGVSFTSSVFALQLMTAPCDAPMELAGLTDPPEPWPFNWDLQATGRPRTLEGTLKSDAGNGSSEGKVTLTKDPEFSGS